MCWSIREQIRLLIVFVGGLNCLVLCSCTTNGVLSRHQRISASRCIGNARPVVIPRPHEKSISSIRFLDEDRLLTTSIDGTCRIWSTRDGEELLRFSEHRDPILCVAVSGDGNLIATAAHDGSIEVNGQVGDGTRSDLFVWDSVSGDIVWELRSIRGSVNAVAVSGDGKLVAFGGTFEKDLRRPGERSWASVEPGPCFYVWSREGRLLNWWDRPKLKEKIQDVAFTTNSFEGPRLLFSPDGTMLLLSEGGSAKESCILIDLKRDHIRCLTERPFGFMSTASFSPDGKLVLTAEASGRHVRIWDSSTGNLLNRIITPWQRFIRASFSPDGRSLVISLLGYWSEKVPSYAAPSILVYGVTVRKGKCELPLVCALSAGNDHSGRLIFCFSRDGRYFASRELVHLTRGTFKIWNAETWGLAAELESPRDLKGHLTEENPTPMPPLFSPGARLFLTLDEEESIYLWKLETLLSNAASNAGQRCPGPATPKRP